MSSCLIHFYCYQETRFPFPHKSVADFLSSNCSSRVFLGLDISAKEISTFQNPFNCAIEELLPILHLEVIHLQCNDMIKGKYKEKNLMQFYECFWHDEYAQLKSYAYQLVPIFASPCLYEKTFSKVKFVKISLVMYINKWISMVRIGNTNFESQLNEMLSFQTNFILLIGRSALQNLYYYYILNVFS